MIPVHGLYGEMVIGDIVTSGEHESQYGNIVTSF